MKRYRSLYLFMSLLLLAGYAWLFFELLSSLNNKYTTQICLFHRVTGYACPSCGTTRSIASILHGDLIDALLINPLGLIAFTGLLILPLIIVFDLISGKRYLVKLYEGTERMVRKPKIAFVLIFLVIVNWIWNIYKAL